MSSPDTNPEIPQNEINLEAQVAVEGIHEAVSLTSTEYIPKFTVGDSVILEGVYDPDLKGAHAHIVPQGSKKKEEPDEHLVVVHTPVGGNVSLLPRRAYEDTMVESSRGSWPKG